MGLREDSPLAAFGVRCPACGDNAAILRGPTSCGASCAEKRNHLHWQCSYARDGCETKWITAWRKAPDILRASRHRRFAVDLGVGFAFGQAMAWVVHFAMDWWL